MSHTTYHLTFPSNSPSHHHHTHCIRSVYSPRRCVVADCTYIVVQRRGWHRHKRHGYMRKRHKHPRILLARHPRNRATRTCHESSCSVCVVGVSAWTEGDEVFWATVCARVRLLVDVPICTTICSLTLSPVPFPRRAKRTRTAIDNNTFTTCPTFVVR